VAFDRGEKTIREERFDAYKANRAPMPEDLVPQIPLVRRALEAYRVPVLELPAYEADDVIGSLARRAVEGGYDVVLVTADKDFFQLVAPHVTLLHTGRNKRYDEAAVEEDFGVGPERVADVLALMGDAVDNVPGVPGIGEKGAKQLIRDFGSLEALLERAAEIPRKAYREGLLSHRQQALLSKELVTIHRDLDIPFEPEALRLDPPDLEALRQLFGELEFFSLLEELRQSEPGPSQRQAGEVATPEQWRRLEAGLPRRLALALVGPVEAPWGLSVAAAAEPDAAPWFLDFRRPGLQQAAVESLARWAGEAACELVGHDLKEVLRQIPGRPAVRARLHDTMLASYVLRPALQGHALEEVALDRLRRTLRPVNGQAPFPGEAAILEAAAERVDVAALLAREMEPEIGREPKLAWILEHIELPLLPVLLAMEEDGILLDGALLARMSEELGHELAGLERDIFAAAGEPFNLNSPQQLGVILFEKLAYPVLGRTRKTKSYTTGAETLEELAARGYPLAEKILRYRELSKLKSTYVDTLPGLADAGGRLHTRFQQAVAATGRLSSANPNLQNIPVRTELGRRIRGAFRAAPGHELLVADYNQIELRVLAHIAKEEALVEAFRAGEDIHRSTAATVFGVASGLVTSEQRRAAKVINFGILYGMSAFGLARTLGIPTPEADRFIKSYLERFPAVRRYMEETLASAQANGQVETLFGRLRPLPDIASKSFALRENARRMAINARIQGTAADLLKLAMIAIAGRLEGTSGRLLLSVHDELVVEVACEDCAAVGETVRREMEGVAQLDVPLAVDVGHAVTWQDAKP
jgi:DNA polymerase-1